MNRLALFVACLALPACGGGGGGAEAPVTAAATLNLGLQPSSVGRLLQIEVTNPLAVDATASLDDAVGPAVPASGVFPASAPAGGLTTLTLIWDSQGRVGLLPSTWTIAYAGAGGQQGTLTLTLNAAAEAVTVVAVTTALDFGEVLIGSSADRALVLENRSTLSPSRVSSVALPAGGFSVVTPLPVSVPPGETLPLTLRYTPTAPGAPSGNALVTNQDLSGPESVALRATTGGQEVVDFGTETFDAAGLTPERTFDLPADAISFTVEAYAAAGTVIGLGKLTAPDARVFENETATGFYFQYPDDGVFSALVPNTDKPLEQIGAGVWKFRIARFGGPATTTDVRVIIERRPGGTGSVAKLDLNVFFSNAIGPKAATAPTDPDVQALLTSVDTLLSQQGIGLGDVDFYDVADPQYDDVSDAEFPNLLALSSMAAQTRLNYFLVRTAIGGGVLGLAAKIGGPQKNGTPFSGVMGLWIENPSASQLDLVARVTAHEMGHFIGLRHSAESNGTHDLIDDTVQCGSGGCAGTENDYLMHWNAGTGGSIITNGQGLVGRGHALMDADVIVTSTSKPVPRLVSGLPADITVPENWCGTCRHCRELKQR